MQGLIQEWKTIDYQRPFVDRSTVKALVGHSRRTPSENQLPHTNADRITRRHMAFMTTFLNESNSYSNIHFTFIITVIKPVSLGAAACLISVINELARLIYPDSPIKIN